MKPDNYIDSSTGKAAVIVGKTGETLSFRQLTENSKKLANKFRESGLGYGDHIAALLENPIKIFEIAWAAQRCGLIYSFIGPHWKANDKDFILRDINPKAVICEEKLLHSIDPILSNLPNLKLKIVVGESLGDWLKYTDILQQTNIETSEEEIEGQWMFYSSGTTGRPKGVKLNRPKAKFGERILPNSSEKDKETIYLSPDPLYYGGGLRPAMLVIGHGGTVIAGQGLELEELLETIPKYKVNKASFRADYLTRIFKEYGQKIEKYDISTLAEISHGGTPISVSVKAGLINLVGPIINESYAATEAAGVITSIGADEWLKHKGSVGKPGKRKVYILDDEQNEVPPEVIGYIYFDNPIFEYHNNQDATRAAYSRQGWATCGDSGYLTADGYLYIADRSANLIKIGEHNIYPSSIENVIAEIKEVRDVALIESADSTGQILVAFISLTEANNLKETLQGDIKELVARRLDKDHVPDRVIVINEIPRSKSGKLIRPALHQILASL